MAKRSTAPAKAALTKGKQLQKSMGELITWSSRTNKNVKHDDVVAALKDVGLDSNLCKDLLPRNAWSRAAKSMKDNRLIDAVNESADEIVFQFTRKHLQSEELTFQKECFLRLNKTTGKVSCKSNPDLEVYAQQLMDEAMVARTTSDITKIVQTLFDQNAALFPCREEGGVYFVPQEHTEFVTQVQTFLESLGGMMNRFPLLAGTVQGDNAVKRSVTDSMERLLQEHEDAIGAFTLSTRKDTLENAAERIKETRVRLQAYSHYLDTNAKTLLEKVDAADQHLREVVQNLSTQRLNMPVQSDDGKLIYGHAVTAVLRKLGSEAWTFSEAREAMDRNHILVADATIRAQLSAGRQGQRGEPAPLTEEQLTELAGKQVAVA